VRLELYKPSYFGILAGWVTGPAMLLQFAGKDFTYPITQDQLSQYQSKYTDRQFYLGFAGNEPAFFGEIIPLAGTGPRLGRLLVGEPTSRGNGLGSLFIRLMTGECVRLHQAKTVELVWEHNAPAIRCCKRTGFEFIPTDPYVMSDNGVAYKLLKMGIGAAGL
jgi:RimJ/RimL family protein N-acetyltransferase